MVRLRLARHVGKVVVAQGVLLGEGPVGGNVGCLVLRLCGAGHSAGAFVLQPRIVAMSLIGVGILGVGENFALGAGEGAEVIIKGMVLFGDDDYMCDGRGHELLYLYAPRRAFGTEARTARTLSFIWCTSLPWTMSFRIAANTFPASSTVPGGMWVSCAGWAAPPKGSSLVTPPGSA